MSKTKSTQLTTVDNTEESQDYKRKRMLEVRHMVAEAVKKDVRVDLMGFNGTDIARSQIALQDLLTKEKEKHAKAGNHIVNLKTDLEMLHVGITVILEGLVNTIQDQAQEIKELTQALDMSNNHCHQTAIELDNTMREHFETQYKYQAMKTTLKDLQNG